MRDEYRADFLRTFLGTPLDDMIGGYRMNIIPQDTDEKIEAEVERRLSIEEVRILTTDSDTEDPTKIRIEVIVVSDDKIVSSTFITIDASGVLAAVCDDDTQSEQSQLYIIKSIVRSVRNLFLETQPGMDFDKSRDAIPVEYATKPEDGVALIARSMLSSIDSRTMRLKRSCNDVNRVFRSFDDNSDLIMEGRSRLEMKRIEAIVHNYRELYHYRWKLAENQYLEWCDSVSMVRAFLCSAGLAVHDLYSKRLNILDDLGKTYFEEAYKNYKAGDDGMRVLKEAARRAGNDNERKDYETKVALMERLAISITFLVGSFTILATIVSLFSFLFTSPDLGLRIACTVSAIVVSVIMSWIIAGRAGTWLMRRLEKKWKKAIPEKPTGSDDA